MLQIWSTPRLLRLDFEIRRYIRFYAPLLDSLDFFGVDPVSYTRAGTLASVLHRTGSQTIAANVPPFEYSSDMPMGIKITSGATLQFSSGNALDDASTLIWFEEGVPKSTPTNTNPFGATGIWGGNLTRVKHIVKATRTLANSEITAIQEALEDVVQTIPVPPPPPTVAMGTFLTETPSHQSGAVYLLSQDPDLNSLLLTAHGGLTLTRVGSSPGNLEFTAGGTGNRTLTLGLAPSPTNDIQAQYVVA